MNMLAGGRHTRHGSRCGGYAAIAAQESDNGEKIPGTRDACLGG